MTFHKKHFLIILLCMVLAMVPAVQADASDVHVSVTFVAGGVVVGGVYFMVYFTVGHRVDWASIQEAPQSMFNYNGKRWSMGFPQIYPAEDTHGKLMPCVQVLGIRF